MNAATTYRVGDVVNVLVFGKVRGAGRIHTITHHSAASTIVAPGTPIYWVEGFKTGKAAEQLAPVAVILEPAADWMHHAMTCATRQIGGPVSRCDCGAVTHGE